ncbi:MAG: prepilin peptidase [Actinomycetota bacterium]|nr:prepilin peptidase [Actinomycetota bacterium]
MTALLLACTALVGLAVGSFANVVAHRVPQRVSVVAPRSRCGSCGVAVRSLDNVPVLSYLLLRGRCRSCGDTIPIRYVVVEAATSVLFAVMALRFGLSPVLPAYLWVVASLVVISVIDAEHYLVLNRVLYPSVGVAAALFVLAAAVDGSWSNLLHAAVGAVAAFGVMAAVHFVKPSGLGFGDVRLSALLGLALGWLGVAQVAVGMFFGFLLGSVFGIALVLTTSRTTASRLPFAPFLAAGALLGVVAGGPVVHAWLG